MELDAHEKRVVFEFEDLHPFASVIASDKVQTGAFQRLNVSRVDFPTVTVTFVDD